MTKPVNRLSRIFNEMDARTLTTLMVSLILVVFVCLMLFFGRDWLHLNNDQTVQNFMAQIATSPFAIIGVITMFCLLAMVGFPQILLIATAVAAFGPIQGAVFSWIATIISASITFSLGHFLGQQWVRRFGGDRVYATIGFLSRHGILASGLIRVVPSAPFIVVNAAAGAAHIPILKYWLGTGIGIIPKIAFVAALGMLAPDASLLIAQGGSAKALLSSLTPRDYILIALLVPVWFGFLYGMRKLYLRIRARSLSS